MVLDDGMNVSRVGSRRRREQVPDGEGEGAGGQALADQVPQIPAGRDEQLAWVRDAEDINAAGNRAGLVYAAAQDAGLTPEEMEELGAQLREAVYGQPDPGAAPSGESQGTGAVLTTEETAALQQQAEGVTGEPAFTEGAEQATDGAVPAEDPAQPPTSGAPAPEVTGEQTAAQSGETESGGAESNSA